MLSREMTIYRRHLISCRYHGAGRDINRCKCPIWIQGVSPLDGKRIRRTLGTSDWKAAGRELSKLESGEKILSRTVAECLDRWWASLHVKSSTLSNYIQAVNSFKAFSGSTCIADVSFELVEQWRNKMLETLAPISVNRQHTVLIVAFNWLQIHGWMRGNPARGLKKLKVQPADRTPYTQAEIARLFAACDDIGQTDYERRRAKAALFLLYYTGLRISDVAMLSKDRVKDGRLLIRTRKTGEPIECALPDAALAALAALPEPDSRTGVSGGRHFFWNGVCKEMSCIHMVMRTLEAVWKKAGFDHCHIHKIRHTIATRILDGGGTAEDAADVLGNSPAIVWKHYVRYTKRRQDRIDAVLRQATEVQIQPIEQPIIFGMGALSKQVN